MSKNNLVLIRGGGDLATGVALRLHRSGIKVVISELAQPLAVRRTVSFSEAVYEGSHTVEGVTARLIEASQLAAQPERRRRENAPAVLKNFKEYGADGFIEKPFNLSELIEKIESVMEECRFNVSSPSDD